MEGGASGILNIEIVHIKDVIMHLETVFNEEKA